MLVNVWVAAWQMQCCGSPFAESDLVEWTLSTLDDVGWLESLVGDRTVPSVEFSWEKHGPSPVGSTTTNGVVEGIRSVRCAHAPLPDGDPNTLYPVAGSGHLETVHSADGWDRDAKDLKFTGYIVALDVPHWGRAPGHFPPMMRDSFDG